MIMEYLLCLIPILVLPLCAIGAQRLQFESAISKNPLTLNSSKICFEVLPH